jgi:septal ring factor EnvC (AmiA/AmiB activator)
MKLTAECIDEFKAKVEEEKRNISKSRCVLSKLLKELEDVHYDSSQAEEQLESAVDALDNLRAVLVSLEDIK